MKIAYKTQSQNSDKHPQMPDSYYWQKYEINDDRQSEFENLGFTVLSETIFNSTMSAIDMTAYNTAVAPTIQEVISNAIIEAQKFGIKLVDQFKSENVLLGISSTDKIPFVVKFMHNLDHYLASGSTKEAISELDRLILSPDITVITIADPTQLNPAATKSYTKAQLSPFITNARLTIYKNMLQDYHGIPRT
jgi:hypothetical protein